jgi:hypothetical protein
MPLDSPMKSETPIVFLIVMVAFVMIVQF